jgi:hypothetical protein
MVIIPVLPSGQSYIKSIRNCIACLSASEMCLCSNHSNLFLDLGSRQTPVISIHCAESSCRDYGVQINCSAYLLGNTVVANSGSSDLCP